MFRLYKHRLAGKYNVLQQLRPNHHYAKLRSKGIALVFNRLLVAGVSYESNIVISGTNTVLSLVRTCKLGQILTLKPVLSSPFSHLFLVSFASYLRFFLSSHNSLGATLFAGLILLSFIPPPWFSLFNPRRELW
jgi:hypothetical protein